jgi:hypothetical protein
MCARVMQSQPREARILSLEPKQSGGVSVFLFATPHSPFAIPSSIEEAERRQTLILILRTFRCGSRFAKRARLSASHHGSRQRESSSLRLSFRPCFLGRGLNGCYPPSPVPAQGNTPRPGHSAGGLMPEAARGKGVWPRPQAPHSPQPPRSTLPDGVLGERDDSSDVTTTVTIVKRTSL